MSSCGAIPGQLINFSSWATGKDDDLKSKGHSLNQAVEDLQRSGPDSTFLSVGYGDYAGNDVIGFGTRYGITDTWVGQVGNAFLQAAMGTLPASMRSQYSQSYLNLPVTMDESALAYVGDDPIVDAQKQADAAKLAEALKVADDNHDGDQLRAVLQQLDAHRNDPVYTSAFFNELGAGYTMQTVRFIFSDPGLLQTFDTALGTASNSTSLDPNLIPQLFDWNSTLHPPMNAYERGVLAWHLLEYGTFSSDFLTQAADAYIRTPPRGGVPGHWFSTIMEALSRNPGASTAYLNTTINGKPMVQYLLIVGHNINYMDPQAGRAFGDMLYAATVTSPWADTYHMKILQQLAGADWHNLPDGARASVGLIIAKYLPELSYWVDDPHRAGTDATLSWQADLFRMAELLSDGSINQQGYDNVKNALAGYLQAGPPAGMAAQDWFDRVGKLYGLASLPLSQSHAIDANNVNGMLANANDGFAVMMNFFPDWATAKIPSTTLSIIANHVFGSLQNDVSSAANTDIGRLQDQTMVAANASAVYQLYQSDHSIVPASVAAQGQTAIDSYLGQLADPFADPSTFADQKQKNVVEYVLAMDNHIKDAFTNQNTSLGI
jgi:hypothetical protein